MQFQCTDNGNGCHGAGIDDLVNPGVYVQYVCFSDTNTALRFEISSVGLATLGPGNTVGTSNVIGGQYYMLLTNNTVEGITVAVPLNVDDSLDGVTITCTDQSDSSFVETQLNIRGINFHCD